MTKYCVRGVSLGDSTCGYGKDMEGICKEKEDGKGKVIKRIDKVARNERKRERGRGT